ncbi:MAG: hypothetical protein K0B87_05055 [Candidatus Syntrophosphaera sp.]|nr:hypothetical protein [Candidatus Syntrophosphaera sp.]
MKPGFNHTLRDLYKGTLNMARRILGLLPVIPALFLLASVSGQTLFALEVPFFAAFHSDNHAGYHPDRDIRKLDWDERYLLSFGIDDLRWRDFGFGLELTSRPSFIRQQVLIDSLAITWARDSFALAGMTKPQGIGRDYFFQQRFVFDPEYNSYQYAHTRFNGLEFTYLRQETKFQAGVGGNVHNLAMAHLAASGSAKQLRWGLRLDGNARDTHWTTPSFMPTLSVSYLGDDFTLRTDTAYKQVLPQADKPSHQEIFHASEASYVRTGWPKVLLGFQYLERDHAPRHSLGLEAALIFRASQFSLSPAYHYKVVDTIQIHKFDLLSEWNPLPQIRLGAYASHEIPDTHKTLFTLGLQSSLRLGP